MRFLYLDCSVGISGDRFVAALLDAGLERKKFETELKKLPLSITFSIKKDTTYGIAGTRFIVNEQAYNDGEEADHEERHLGEIFEILDKSALSANIIKRAKSIFLKLADAESKVHGKDKADIHFHEVGAIDSIADIVGAAIAVELLRPDAIYSSEINVGHGGFRFSHGYFHAPSLATAHLLKGFPVYANEIKGELTTPTGAAIISSLASYKKLPRMKIEKIGYGIGSRDIGQSNALRVLIGDK